MSLRNLIVGIGSSHGHDQVGWHVAERIKQRPPSDCDVRIVLAPADILDWIQQYQSVHICDACSGNATEPVIHRWLWPSLEIENLAWGGTHDLSLPAILELATTLGLAPAEIVVWGIEVPDGARGANALTAIDPIISRAADEIRQALERTAERCNHA